MKNKIKAISLLIVFAIPFIISSCADSKEIDINGKMEHVEPYGWADYQDLKNDSVIYKVSVGNIVWSVLLCQTIVVPIWLTGYGFYEPAWCYL